MTLGTLILNAPATFRDGSDAISDSSWNGPNGTAVRYCMSILWDAIGDWVQYSAEVGSPSIAPYDAMQWAGVDRVIVQGFQESTASYRARLVQWLDRWPYSGKATGVLLAARGWILPQLPEMAVVTDSGTWWEYVSGVDPMPTGAQTVTPAVWTFTTLTNWNWDYSGGGHSANPHFWARSWLVIWSTTVVWASPESNTWGTGPWGDGGVWGFSQAANVFSGIAPLVASWKAKHEIYPAIIVSFDDTLFQATSDGSHLPDGHWGDWHKLVNNIAVAGRSGSARYIESRSLVT